MQMVTCSLVVDGLRVEASPNRECEDLSFPKKHTLVEVWFDQFLMIACIVRCADSAFSLWQIFYSTVRLLTKFKTRTGTLSDEYDRQLRGLDWREDEHLLFYSARSRGIYKFYSGGEKFKMRNANEKHWGWKWAAVKKKAKTDTINKVFCEHIRHFTIKRVF